MKNLLRATALLTGALLAFSGLASAGDFTPEITFELSETKVKAHPELEIDVSQENGEDELAHVTLTIPKGFKLPPDAAIENGEELGSGSINIAVGPGCRPDFPNKDVKQQVQGLPATLVEQDRSDAQIDEGVYAVWVLDISGVTEIALEVTGSKGAGWKIDGDIPPNDNTCPPFSFTLTVSDTSSESNTPILVNPKKPGKKTFIGTFTSLDTGAISETKQVIKITR